MEKYNATSIEVLNGLDPVKVRPGMYTDTTRPNHLAQELIDNSVDEAIAGFATKIDVILYKDNSLEVIDNGRGMPIDIHPEEKMTGVEVILTKLHAGGKFSSKNYQFSGGLHGVGVSVVNALSEKLHVQIKRGGNQYEIHFSEGEKTKPLTKVKKVAKKDTGTAIRFWAKASYFDHASFLTSSLLHILRAKAVLCPKLKITFYDQNKDQFEEWYYENGLEEYLNDDLKKYQIIPAPPFVGYFDSDKEVAHWAVAWNLESPEVISESYVNLIPTPQGGTHVNGFRTGLLEAIREFCELRKLLPRGIKLSVEDVWQRCCYILSVKMKDPQFSGQTKERLSSRQCASFVAGVVKDSFSLWLHKNTKLGEQITELVIAHAQERLKNSKKIARKKIATGPALPGKLADCISQDPNQSELFLVEGDSAGGSAKQARNRQFQAVMPLRGKILNTWDVDSSLILNSQEIHDISIAIGIEPNSENLEKLRYKKICILADADSDGLHIATLLCALFYKHFKPLVYAGHIYVAMPPLYRIDIGKEVYYALDEEEKENFLQQIQVQKKKGNINIQRFKGLGEMNPIQLRETTMSPDTRKLIQLTVDHSEATSHMLDMLLGKKRAMDRREWLQEKGDLISL